LIRSLDQVDEKGSVIIQSHGAPRQVFKLLRQKHIDVIDATCPMVKLIHQKIFQLHQEGHMPVIIGKKGHDEVRGIAGQVPRAIIIGSPGECTGKLFKGPRKVGIVVQSTFIREEALKIVKKIRAFVPDVHFIDTICRPTTDRQEEVKSISDVYDWILIVGSKSSANTRHLYRLASGKKAKVHLVDDPESVSDLDIPANASVFIASGASTPRHLIENVVENLRKNNPRREMES